MMIQTLKPELTLSKLKASSKKRALEKAAALISTSTPELDAEELFEQLIARERLGSTGIGKGVAIPHCRSNHVHKLTACLVTLNELVDFDAIDNNPVDILFVIVVPEAACNEHLETLASIAKLMDNAEHRNQLRHAATSSELFEKANYFLSAA